MIRTIITTFIITTATISLLESISFNSIIGAFGYAAVSVGKFEI